MKEPFGNTRIMGNALFDCNFSGRSDVPLPVRFNEGIRNGSVCVCNVVVVGVNLFPNTEHHAFLDEEIMEEASTHFLWNTVLHRNSTETSVAETANLGPL